MILPMNIINKTRKKKSTTAAAAAIKMVHYALCVNHNDDADGNSPNNTSTDVVAILLSFTLFLCLTLPIHLLAHSYQSIHRYGGFYFATIYLLRKFAYIYHEVMYPHVAKACMYVFFQSIFIGSLYTLYYNAELNSGYIYGCT